VDLVERLNGDATLACTLLLPATHAEMKRARPGAAATPGGLVSTPPPPSPLPAVLLLGGFGLSQAEIDANVAELHATYEAVRAAFAEGSRLRR
jgi:hypothetical protein